jgi:hypothetical protein
MLSISSLIIIFLIAVGIGFWQSASRAKELAIATCKSVCAQRDLQFLDGTVHLLQIRLRRNSRGRVSFWRRYGFDYYDGQARLTSTITIFDDQMVETHLPTKNPEEKSDNVIPFPKDKK